MKRQDPRLGIVLMVLATLVFSLQDTISRYLSAGYNVMMVVMIRYWFFAAFVLFLAWRSGGGIAGMARTRRPFLQILRGLLLVAEICVTVSAFVWLGLVETHAIFATYPLMILALAGPFLGERLDRRGWLSVMLGLIGVLIILRPGSGMFSFLSLVPLLAALMFAIYSLLTRCVLRHDSTGTSLFWTGIAGAAGMTLAGTWFWQEMTAGDWGWMAALSASGVLGHWLLIRCYDLAEASTVQPFANLQLVFASLFGIVLFGDRLTANIAVGGGLVVFAGLLALGRFRPGRTF